MRLAQCGDYVSWMLMSDDLASLILVNAVNTFGKGEIYLPEELDTMNSAVSMFMMLCVRPALRRSNALTWRIQHVPSPEIGRRAIPKYLMYPAPRTHQQTSLCP